MVEGSDNVEFKFAVRGGLEDARIDFNLFDTGAVEFFERRNNARLLACARGTVYKEMWEIAALCLQCHLLDALQNAGAIAELLTRARKRSESSGW